MRIKIFMLSVLLAQVGVITAQAASEKTSQVSITETCSDQLTSQSSVVQRSLDVLTSFSYVHQALEVVSTPGSTFCVMAIPLSRNDYDYLESYVRIDVYAKGASAPAYRFRFLYQDASIQAYHGITQQPWIGLPLAPTVALFTGLAPQSLGLSTGHGLNEIPDFASRAALLDAGTIGTTPLSAETLRPQDADLSLTFALTQPANNPFEGVVIPWAGMLEGSPASFTAYASVNLTTDLRFPLEDLVSKTAASLPSDRTLWAQALLALARQP